MKIKNEAEYRKMREQFEALIQKGTELTDMELLPDEDKKKYVELSEMLSQWDAAYHPLPGKVSTLVTDAIKEKMAEKNIKQKEVARFLGVPESRISEILSGKRPLNLNIVKRLRDNLGIPADFILDNLT